jgi:predicted transposase YbfD/YdcC
MNSMLTNNFIDIVFKSELSIDHKKIILMDDLGHQWAILRSSMKIFLWSMLTSDLKTMFYNVVRQHWIHSFENNPIEIRFLDGDIHEKILMSKILVIVQRPLSRDV